MRRAEQPDLRDDENRDQQRVASAPKPMPARGSSEGSENDHAQRDQPFERDRGWRARIDRAGHQARTAARDRSTAGDALLAGVVTVPRCGERRVHQADEHDLVAQLRLLASSPASTCQYGVLNLTASGCAAK